MPGKPTLSQSPAAAHTHACAALPLPPHVSLRCKAARQFAAPSAQTAWRLDALVRTATGDMSLCSMMGDSLRFVACNAQQPREMEKHGHRCLKAACLAAELMHRITAQW